VALSGDWARFGQALANLARIDRALAGSAALEPLAQAIQQNAQGRLGTYQAAQDSFPAWQSLATATQAERVRLGFTPDDPLLRSGALRDALVYSLDPDGKTAYIGIPSGDSTAAAALAAELGTAHAPQRAFLGPAALEEMRHLAGYVRPIFRVLITA
jgi:hypothetical protein